MEVIVSSKKLAVSQAKEFKPDFVISIADPDDTHPVFTTKSEVLSLDFHDISFENKSPYFLEHYTLPSREDVQRIYDFAKTNFDDDSRVLVHCYAGISRSSAASIISLCAYMPFRNAVDKIANLETMTYTGYIESGHIWFAPNALMIQYADEMLGLNGEMMEYVSGKFRY